VRHFHQSVYTRKLVATVPALAGCMGDGETLCEGVSLNQLVALVLSETVGRRVA
jgi:hypothetical protein